MVQNLISDFTVNAWWEFIAAIMLTAIARIFRMTFGKKMTNTHEIIFWAGCIICGTIVLAVANVGIIKPIQDRLLISHEAPDLQCELDGFMVGSGDENKPGNFGQIQHKSNEANVTFLVRIVNGGSQSVAWKWKLHVVLASGEPLDSDAVEAPITLFNGTNDMMKLTPDRYLPNALLENPLINGATKQGWVVFYFDNISAEDLKRFGNKFTVQFQDSKGKISQASYTINSKAQSEF